MADIDGVAKTVLRRKDAPEPWRVALVMALVNALVVGVILVFSDVFATGPAILEALVDFGGYNTTILMGVLAVCTVLYLLDVSYWPGRCGKVLKSVCAVLLIAALVALGVSLVRDYPYLPLCLFILLLPAIVLVFSATILRTQSASASAWTLGLAFFVAALSSLGIWLAWVFGAWHGGDNGNNFWFGNRAEFAADALCNHSGFEVEGAYVADDGTLLCTAAFLLWAAPFILFGCLLFISLFLCILGWSLDSNPDHSGRQALRVLAIAAFTCMFGMYSVTSIGGAGMKLANVAMSTFFCVLVGIVLAGAAAIGRERSLTTLKSTERTIVNFFVAHPGIANLGRAFFLCVGLPVLGLMLALSFVNQCIRRLGFNRGRCQPLPADEAKQPFTAAFMHQIDAMRRWDWGTVLKFAYYLCAAMWVFIYFSKVTYIFFNWLVTVLQPLSFWLVVGIFIVIGLVMFLIPVVPGPAVYLTAGVLVVPLGKTYFSGGAKGFDACAAADAADGGSGEPVDNALWAFWLSAAFTSLISWSLKLIAHVMQQKLIGEMLSGYVGVRAIVGPNSRQMKAVRYLLSQPGLTLAKASILCGGPDWPTSVLCGLLKLNVFQMLIGLTPIVLFTTPGTLLGAFMTEPTYSDMNLDTVCTLVLLLIQVLMCVSFMHYINDVLLQHADDLDAYEDDAEVAKLDAEAAQYAAVVAEVGGFERAPLHFKAMLITGFSAGLVSTWALYFFSSSLFQEFAITDCLDDLGMPREDYVIPFLGMKLPGLACILLMCFGAACLKFYGDCWVHEQARTRIDYLKRTRPNETSTGAGGSERELPPTGGSVELAAGPNGGFVERDASVVPPMGKAMSMSERDSESGRPSVDDGLNTPRSRDAVVSVNSKERHHVSTSL